jgi:hypothetical protein
LFDLKSLLETEAIKKTLTTIFLCLNEATASHTIEQSTKNIKDGFTIFLNMLAPQEDFTYDLLPWALEEYTNSYISRLSLKLPLKAKPAAKEYASLIEFVVSLSNHFRATPPLVRYGACICLYSAIKVYPQLIQENRQIYNFIISGALDSDYICQFLYTTMLEVVKPDQIKRTELTTGDQAEDNAFTHFSSTIRSMTSSIRHVDKQVTYDSIYGGNEAIAATFSLGDILDESARSCPALPPKVLHRAANSLDYFPRKEKLRQLELIRVWAGRSDKVFFGVFKSTHSLTRFLSNH